MVGVKLLNGENNIEFGDIVDLADIFVFGDTFVCGDIDKDGLRIENVVDLGNCAVSDEFRGGTEFYKQNNYDISTAL